MIVLSGDVKFCGEALGEVQIQTTNADGSMRELTDILADCRVAFPQLSESEQVSAAKTLVGKNAMSDFLALMNTAPADIEKLQGAISSCDGTSLAMAETMQDNFAGQLTILKSQLEELAISFSDILMPTIRSIVSHIQGLVDKLNQLDPQTKEIIVKIALIAAALGPLLIVIGKTISDRGQYHDARVESTCRHCRCQRWCCGGDRCIGRFPRHDSCRGCGNCSSGGGVYASVEHE